MRANVTFINEDSNGRDEAGQHQAEATIFYGGSGQELHPNSRRTSAPTLAAPMTTITVTDTGDGAATPVNCPGANCRLRDAIAAAATGNTIDFSVTGTITLTSGELAIA